jgi:hypothetical protein
MRTRLRSEQGQATIEFGGTLLWLILAAVFAWQMGLVAWSWVSANNAARTTARLYSRTGDATQAASDGKKSLSGVLSKNANVNVDQSGDAKVTIDIPLVLPGLGSGLDIHENAVMPYTG